jgi:hypothetical protein
MAERCFSFVNTSLLVKTWLGVVSSSLSIGKLKSVRIDWAGIGRLESALAEGV